MADRIVKLLRRPARLVWIASASDLVLDYTLDWSARLDGGDAIASSTFALPAGLVADRASNTAATATVWISSGAAAGSYEIVNRVETLKRRTIEQAIKLRVKAG
jgi:hypothetical protein